MLEVCLTASGESSFLGQLTLLRTALCRKLDLRFSLKEVESDFFFLRAGFYIGRDKKRNFKI